MKLDKDIEILKGIKRCSLTGGFDKQTERLNAISRIIAIVKNNRMAFEKQTENLREVEAERDNLKSELETYKTLVDKNVIKQTINTKEYYENIDNLEEVPIDILRTMYKDNLSERKTFEKIAEKLAEEVDDNDPYKESEKYCQYDVSECSDTKRKCKQCIIDWARNEVKKDG